MMLIGLFVFLIKLLNICFSSSIEYVGIQTIGGHPTDFSSIKATIAATLDNNNIRSRRRLSVIFKALKVKIESNSLAFHFLLSRH
jgi:hypothetical protein